MMIESGTDTAKFGTISAPESVPTHLLISFLNLSSSLHDDSRGTAMLLQHTRAFITDATSSHTPDIPLKLRSPRSPLPLATDTVDMPVTFKIAAHGSETFKSNGVEKPADILKATWQHSSETLVDMSSVRITTLTCKGELSIFPKEFNFSFVYLHFTPSMFNVRFDPIISSERRRAQELLPPE